MVFYNNNSLFVLLQYRMFEVNFGELALYNTFSASARITFLLIQLNYPA